MTKQHCEYKILRWNVFGGSYKPTPPKCTVSHCANGPGWPLWQINFSLLIAQIWLLMTQNDWLWSGMTYHGSEGCQGTQGAPAAAGGAKQLPPGGQSYFLSNGWSKSIVLENKVAINFDFRSGAKKSGHLDYPFQSYGPKFVNMHKYAYVQLQ